MHWKYNKKGTSDDSWAPLLSAEKKKANRRIDKKKKFSIVGPALKGKEMRGVYFKKKGKGHSANRREARGAAADGRGKGKKKSRNFCHPSLGHRVARGGPGA